MEMTQDDFEERLSRVEDGTADDEDRRLVKHYRREGFEPGGSAPASTARNPFADDDEVDNPAPTDYSKLTKRELVAELDTRTNSDGTPLEFDPSARNDVLIGTLQQNDQQPHREA
jgi:hypothetical protein